MKPHLFNGIPNNKNISAESMGVADRRANCALAPKVPGAAGGRPSLDTHTPQSAHLRKPFRTDSDRRLYSRVSLGLLLPGRYYFITLTSSPESPKLEKSWNSLRQWLKRYRPGIVWVYCFTSEGHGVIHMVVRLGLRQKRIIHKELSAAWLRIHKAPIVWIKRVQESQKDNLANYLSDQRKLKKMGSEFAWQPGIIRWRWSKGWIPQGFAKQFGRFWWQYQNKMDITPGQRDKIIKDWICKEALVHG